MTESELSLSAMRKHKQDCRQLMLDHLDVLEKLDAIMVANIVRDVLEDPGGVVDQLAAVINKARRDTLDLCLPEKESADELD
jgi:hypothetical protein